MAWAIFFFNTGRVHRRSNSWTNCFVPLFLCELSHNHTIRQGGYEQCIEHIQTGCFITLCGLHLGRKFMTFPSHFVKGVRGCVSQIKWYTKRLKRSCRLFSGDLVFVAFFICERNVTQERIFCLVIPIRSCQKKMK